MGCLIYDCFLVLVFVDDGLVCCFVCVTVWLLGFDLVSLGGLVLFLLVVGCFWLVLYF